MTATAPKFFKAIADLSVATPGQYDYLARELRAAGAIPSSTRGQSAPAITRAQAVAILVAVAINAKPSEAVALLPEWLAAASEEGGNTLAHELESILSSDADDVAEVRIARDRPFAVVLSSDGSVAEFGLTDHKAAIAAGYIVAPLRVEFVMSDGGLAALAGEFRETGGGWGKHP